ncbi:unnamed protein product [Amoebophrya sp. A25]|nr:unnamed protein product [Amoebophrya sp. A25]|eukprot:GSA25T00014472001.1
MSGASMFNRGIPGAPAGDPRGDAPGTFTSGGSSSSYYHDVTSGFGEVEKSDAADAGTSSAAADRMPIKTVRILVDDGVQSADWKVDPKFVYDECDHVKLAASRSLPEMHAKIERVQAYINSLGIFKDATCVLDKGTGDNDVDLIFHLRPIKPHYSFGANVNGKGQTTAEFNFDVPCIAGTCTSAKCTAKTPTWRILEGYETQASLFTKRLWGVRGLQASLDLNSSVNDMKPYSSYDEMSKSVNLNFGFAGHNLSVELYNLRNVVLAMGQASTAMQMSRLRSVKTGSRYTFAHRTPSGFFGKISTEIAGFLGDVNLAKGDVCLSKTWSFPCIFSMRGNTRPVDMWHFTLMGAAGHAAALDGRPLCIQDKFFLGGGNGFVNTICKGFGFRRFGPCAIRSVEGGTSGANPEYDYLGGDSYGNASVSLARDFPLREGQVGRAFVFAQGAALGDGGLSKVLTLRLPLRVHLEIVDLGKAVPSGERSTKIHLRTDLSEHWLSSLGVGLFTYQGDF